MAQYYIISKGQQLGPFSDHEVQFMLVDGAITITDLCWTEGMTDWKPIHEVIERPINVPPPPPQNISVISSTVPVINWIPALILNCVGGGFAVIVTLAALADVKVAAGIETLGFFMAVIAVIFWSILHYQCWKELPECFRFTSPGKAIGFLFIPFYNFYWGFISWPKLAEGIIEWQKSLGKPVFTELKSLALVYAILNICGFTLIFITGLDVIITASGIVIFILFYQKIVTVINDINKPAEPPHG